MPKISHCVHLRWISFDFLTTILQKKEIFVVHCFALMRKEKKLLLLFVWSLKSVPHPGVVPILVLGALFCVFFYSELPFIEVLPTWPSAAATLL